MSPVWRRNFLVWRKLAIPSMLGNLADPLIMLFGLGYGLGALLGEAARPTSRSSPAGFVASSTHVRRDLRGAVLRLLAHARAATWDAIINAPLTLDDVLAGECAWAASKALLAGACILVVVGAVRLRALAARAAGAAGRAADRPRLRRARPGGQRARPGYDFFSYYFTLVLTPMMMLSGVFFPAEQLPAAVQAVAQALPLYHGVALVRPLMSGGVPRRPAASTLAVLAAYAVVGFYVATVLTRRRLLK